MRAWRALLDAKVGAVWGDVPEGFLRELFRGVRWTPSFLALLYYTFAILTYHAPGARYAMIVAVAGLVLELQHLRWSAPFTWLAGLVAWAFVSALATNSAIALTGAEDIGKLGIIAFVIYNAVRSPQQLRFYLAFLLGCFLLYPVRGAYVNYLGGYNVFGRAIWNNAYGNPNDLAAFCLVFLSMALAYAVIGRHRLWRLGAIGASGLIGLLVLLTQSRGGFLALVATGLLALITMRQRGQALGVIAIIGVLAIPFVPDTAWERFRGLSKVSTASGMKGVDREGSAQQRYQTLQVAARMAAEHPLFGVGPKMYVEQVPEYSRRFANQYPLARGVKDPHNTYLRLSCELGVPGLLLFLLMIGATVRETWRTSGHLLARGEPSGQVLRLMTLGLVAYLLAGLFSSVPYINVLYLLVAFLSALVAHARGFLRSAALPAPARQGAEPFIPVPLRGLRGGLAWSGVDQLGRRIT